MKRLTVNLAPADIRKAGPAYDLPVDFQDVKGQEHVKRALEAAAAGGHTVVMSGSITFPANFILISAMNPCPNGFSAPLSARAAARRPAPRAR